MDELGPARWATYVLTVHAMVASTIGPGSESQWEATPSRLILRLLGSASLRLLLALRAGIAVLGRSAFALRMGPPIELLSCGTAQLF